MNNKNINFMIDPDKNSDKTESNNVTQGYYKASDSDNSLFSQKDFT